MKHRKAEDYSQVSMLELFRIEAETQSSLLTTGLLELERNPHATSSFESLMRAAHSLKGAARIVNLQRAVHVAHAMEDCFVAAQHGKLQLHHEEVNLLFRGVDLLAQLARRTEADITAWETEYAKGIAEFLEAASKLLPPFRSEVAPNKTSPVPSQRLSAESRPPSAPAVQSTNISPPAASATKETSSTQPSGAEVVRAPKQSTEIQASASSAVTAQSSQTPERVVRLTAESLNRLLGLAGESLVESRWL